ncbi:MAG: NADH-quinone oxidoreductase subunit NuoN [Sphingopyxis sp.]
MQAFDFLLLAPEMVLTAGGLALLMAAAFGGDKSSGLINALAAIVLALAIVAVTRAPGADDALGGVLRLDGFASYAKYLIFGSAIVSLLIAPRFFAGEGYRAEYPVLILFAALGMSIMVSAHDLMSLYIGLELNSLAAYVLASFARNDGRSSEAGLKYFVLGALASGMLLYGSSLLYGFTGTTSFTGIATAFAHNGGIGLTFGIVFLLSGLAFKISAVPFHMWTPDVYEGAPTPVTAFFATAPKVAAMALLTRVCVDALQPAFPAWQQIITFMAIASMVLGAVGAVGQKNIKRLLAYSSIANVGFMLIGLASATPAGIMAMLIYLAVYVVMTLGSFLVLLQLQRADGTMAEDVASLAGLWKSRPALATALSVFMFSLAGIPPLFGFFPKLMVFQAAVGAGMLPLAVIGAVASVIGAFYYLRVIKVMLFDAPADEAFPIRGAVVERGLIAVAALYVSVVGFIAVTPLTNAAGNAVRALL